MLYNQINSESKVCVLFAVAQGLVWILVNKDKATVYENLLFSECIQALH